MMKRYVHNMLSLAWASLIDMHPPQILQIAVHGTEIGSTTIMPGKFWVNLIPGRESDSN